MKTIMRTLALGLAISCLTWVGVLWWWQRSGRVIAEVDMAVYLGLLPLVLLVLVLALRHAWKKADARVFAQQAAPPMGTAGAAAHVDPPAEDERRRHATSRLVHTTIFSTGGAQVSDLLQAVADGKQLPTPDKVLFSDAGLPVMCARIPDALLAPDVCRDRLDVLVQQMGQEDARWQAGQPGEGVVRALAALQEPLLQQRQWLLDLAMRRPEAASVQGPQGVPLPRVHLLLGCAVEWSSFEQALAQRWVETLWACSDEAMAAFYALQVRVVAGSGEALWLQADQFAHATDEDSAPAWLLLAASHSDLDQARIDVLSSAGRLYDPQAVPGGGMPGEAAATVLIAPSDWVAPQDLASPPVLLHRPALVQRSKPVEAAGRVDSQMLREAAHQAMAAGCVTAAQVAALVCDADQHSPRATELYGITIDDLPQLDPQADMRVLAKVTGYIGAASCLLVVACASELARTTSKPVLALGMADSRMRLALIIKPALPEDVAAHDSAPANRTP